MTAFRGQDAVVLTIPVSDTQKNKALVDASIKAGVKRFIPSEFGSDTSSDEAVEKVPFMYPKREISKYLQSKEDSGLTWTAIITGAFFDW